ncbi:50S ribosomal protein L13 [Candidatus Woesebacteria bacterium]|nr:50S ribosomal protein L13 [Candidatus Woesebacteria bacterium]
MAQQTKSTRPVSEKDVVRKWHIIDVKGKTLGREIPRISELLQGKHKVTYVPYLDSGDYVIVINAKGVGLTGRKEQDKEYKYFSGYPNGQKVVKFKDMLARNPKEIVRHAVSGMLPKNKHRDQRLARLYIFENEQHPYADKLANSNSK